MDQRIVRDVVILGGGTAGWMTAAALSRVLNGKVSVTVVESDQIATVGVGEATVPGIVRFNAMLGLDENEFMRETQGTIKLGIDFVDWTFLGDRYMHGFGRFRQDIQLTTFEQIWQKMNLIGRAAEMEAYSITKLAARAGKFMRPRLDVPDSPLADIAYAFQFDASLYARYLRRYAEARGVRRIEGTMIDVARHADGDIAALVLATGERVEAEFFVDCSGFRGRLIEDVFHTGYDDWTHWLPCDRAVTVPCATAKTGITPYTRAVARPAGWQWAIPLQHRTGNGHVFSSQYMSEDEATGILLANLEGEALADPWTLRFATGVRRRPWHRNCLAIGLAGGFLEPLESTSIHLIQSSIMRLLNFFPSAVPSEPDINEYNRLARREYEHIRDFIVLHYHATRRNDTPFWDYCRTMEIPETLHAKMELFQSQGRLYDEADGLFAQGSWTQVMQGQGLRPKGYNSVVDIVDVDDIGAFIEGVRVATQKCIELMPTHEEFIRQNCQAAPVQDKAKFARGALRA
ncbi:MAG TPA: tryptophan halogenase family protein [Burkholderiaceae bacterium]